MHYTGIDTVVLGGTEGHDIAACPDDDTVYGDGGNDRIEGWFGNDNLFGGDGDDIITDMGGTDVIMLVRATTSFLTAITTASRGAEYHPRWGR